MKLRDNIQLIVVLFVALLLDVHFRTLCTILNLVRFVLSRAHVGHYQNQTSFICQNTDTVFSGLVHGCVQYWCSTDALLMIANRTFVRDFTKWHLVVPCSCGSPSVLEHWWLVKAGITTRSPPHCLSPDERSSLYALAAWGPLLASGEKSYWVMYISLSINFPLP